MGLEAVDPMRRATAQGNGRLARLQPAAASARLGWSGLETLLFNDMPDAEIERPPLTHHELVLFNRPPLELNIRYEGVKRHVPPPAGSIMLVPAGTPSRRQWRGHMGSLLVFLEPDLVTRVAAEEFGLDPARRAAPPLAFLDRPQLRAAMLAVPAPAPPPGPPPPPPPRPPPPPPAPPPHP